MDNPISNILDEILVEWSYRVKDGMPDVRNSLHLVELRKVLNDLKMPSQFSSTFIQNLNELDFANKAEFDAYNKKHTMRKSTKVNIGGKETTVGDASGSKTSTRKPTEKLNMYQKRAYMSWKDRTQKSYIAAEYYLTPEEKQLMKEFDTDLDKFLTSKSDEEKKQILEGMVEKYQLRKNASGSKLYVGAINFDARKIFSGESGNSFSKLIGSEMDRLGVQVQQPEGGSDGPKQLATNASKIEYTKETTDGKPTEVTYKNSPVLQEILNKKEFQPLDERPHFKRVWGPRGEDGDLIKSGGKNNKIHLNFSIENDPTLDNVINQLDELEQSHNISPKCKQAVSNHKKRMDDLKNGKALDKNGNPIKVPSKEAAEYVEQSWAEMAITITEESPTVANAMMKNLAEKLEYQRELALGDEVYLPSHGSFPSGDKIKVERDGSGNVVRVDKVSVKYGSAGKYKAFGFPGEVGQYQQWHPDPKYRDRQASRPGVDGYDMGVKDDLIDDDKKFGKLIKDSGLEGAVDGNCIKDKIRKMKKYVGDEKKRIGFDQSRAGVSKKGNVPSQLNKIKKTTESMNKKIGSSINNDCVDMKKLEGLIGKDNARLFSKGPVEAINIIAFAGTLNTGDGITAITHNHQVIDKGPPVKYVNKTSKGDKNIKYWALGFRGIEGRSGGLIASYNEERKDKGFE